MRKRWPVAVDLDSHYSCDHGMCEWMEVCSSCTAVVAAIRTGRGNRQSSNCCRQSMRSEIVVDSGRPVSAKAMGGNPMTHDAHQKVKASHLKRNAYLYVRQSTLRQVFENTESTQRQYALRQHAAALGWPLDRIIVIDTDLGQSGASAADREGFQRLVTEVSLGAGRNRARSGSIAPGPELDGLASAAGDLRADRHADPR